MAIRIKILFLIVYAISGSLLAQSSFIKWIETPLDDRLSILEYFDNHGVYFYSYDTGEYDNSEYGNYLSYSKYYIIADSALNTIDSIQLNSKEGYFLSSLRFLSESEDEIILFGSALDTVTYDEQLYMVWLNNELGIIKDSLYGLPDRDDVMAGFLINHDNHVVFSRRFPLEKEVNETEMKMVFWEFDMEGNEIIYKEDKIPAMPLHEGFDMTEKKRYQFQAMYDVALFNYDLSYDTSYSWYEMMFHFETAKQIDETKYFLIGDYNSVIPPFTYEDFDLAFMIMDDEQDYYNLQKFGTVDTNEMFTNLDFITLDTLFIGGQKWVQPGPFDSWVTVYKTNLNGDIFFLKNFGGYGRNILNFMLATPDGGCIAGCTYWDFYENPDEVIRDIVFLKFNSKGDLVTSIPENTPTIIISDFSIFPNPGSGYLYINSAKENLQIRLFDFTGKLVVEKCFDKSISINTEQLPKGIYSYKIFQKGVQLESGKWMKD